MDGAVPAPALRPPRPGGRKPFARSRRVRRVRHPLATAAAAVIAAIVLAPVVTLGAIAVGGSGADWPHLLANVVPAATWTTISLLFLVAAGSASIGVTAAWLIVAYDFPFRRTLAWALVLPLAVPPYLAAYAFAEFFHFTGPVQSALRGLFGYATPRDYWFPDIRSTGGAAVVMSAVLYPYVYLTTRVVFIMQGRNISDVARTLGARPLTVLWRVLLPVARPAIAAGIALVLMETMNDIGASEYLGVRTLTYAVYTTWLNRGSLEGAAQIAMLMLVLIFALLMAEQWARRRQKFHVGRGNQLGARPPRTRLSGVAGMAASVAVLLPVLVGFGIPLYVFGGYALPRLSQLFEPALAAAFMNSLITALAAALVTVTTALVILNAARIARAGPVLVLARASTVGYALPGTILALGLLFVLAGIDNRIDGFARSQLGFSTGLILTGSASAVVIACAIRFLALAEGAVRSGMEKLPPHLGEAARSLGRTETRTIFAVLLPVLRPAILIALVLVFVDTAKELSATILLRPFGFNTLATFVYENASRGAIEDGAMAALLIIVTAMIPVIILSGALMRDRDASI
ncbi:MAG: iron ABC transporter permease [Brucellaceae bacterium]|nr:iron ABC transporter permease [Brucellaceae bacterium]